MLLDCIRLNFKMNRKFEYTFPTIFYESANLLEVPFIIVHKNVRIRTNWYDFLDDKRYGKLNLAWYNLLVGLLPFELVFRLVVWYIVGSLKEGQNKKCWVLIVCYKCYSGRLDPRYITSEKRWNIVIDFVLSRRTLLNLWALPRQW